jgi:hypothetical protein
MCRGNRGPLTSSCRTDAASILISSSVKTEDHALLADPKLNFQRDDELPKVLAEHGCYGRVMIVVREGVRWMTVGYDSKARKPIKAREFRLADAAGF